MRGSPALALQHSLAERLGPVRADRPARTADPAPRLAVILPCRNEAESIGPVVRAFRAALPHARVLVFDNGSTDGTADLAREAGAEVYSEPRPGKGNVVRRMFADVDADIYLMADGDGTYDAASAPLLVDCVAQGHCDMAVGARADIGQNAHRRGHAVGNRLFNGLYRRLFGAEFGDVFSGYRAFSRRFVKSFPALSSGFEIETELAVHARQLKLPTVEITLPYGARVAGTASKLRTLRDGLRILGVLMYLLKETRPLAFFGLPASAMALLATGLSAPLIRTFLDTGTVPRLPTAVLCTGLCLVAALLTVCGIILDSLARSRAEQKRMLFLAVSERSGG